MSAPQVPSVLPAAPANIFVRYAREARNWAVRAWDVLVAFAGLGPQAQGFVDALKNEVVVGWARDPGHPGRRLEVCVYQGDRVIGSAVADLPRKDLVAARIGDG